jgi:hypothetical protein
VSLSARQGTARFTSGTPWTEPGADVDSPKGSLVSGHEIWTANVNVLPFMQVDGTKICEMEGVREHSERFPVELRRESRTGRLVIRALNEDGHNATDVDLFDLLDWLSRGPVPEEMIEPANGSDANTNR